MLPVRRDDTDLRSTVRRAEAEYDMYTDEHLEALRRCRSPDGHALGIGDRPQKHIRFLQSQIISMRVCTAA